MAYARDKTLLKIAHDKQWGFVQTNEYGSTGEAHLLEMRRRDKEWVKKANWDDEQVLRSGIRASYSDKLAYYYCITMKGFVRLMEVFPEDTILQSMKIILFDKIFNGNEKSWEFIKYRVT